MLFTKEERRQIYERAADTVLSTITVGACRAIFIAAQDLFPQYDKMTLRTLVYSELRTEFPEFDAQRPAIVSVFDLLYWWPVSNREIRKEALLAAVKLTKA